MGELKKFDRFVQIMIVVLVLGVIVMLCWSLTARKTVKLAARAAEDYGFDGILEPELMVWTTDKMMLAVTVPTVSPENRIGSDLWWQRWWAKFDEWEIEQAVIGYESEGRTCLFWARWRDGRELCVPFEPPKAPPTNREVDRDSGNEIIFSEPTADELITLPHVSDRGVLIPFQYEGPKGTVRIDEDGHVEIVGDITVPDVAKTFVKAVTQMIASQSNRPCSEWK